MPYVSSAYVGNEQKAPQQSDYLRRRSKMLLLQLLGTTSKYADSPVGNE